MNRSSLVSMLHLSFNCIIEALMFIRRFKLSSFLTFTFFYATTMSDVYKAFQVIELSDVYCFLCHNAISSLSTIRHEFDGPNASLAVTLVSLSRASAALPLDAYLH